MSSLLDKLAMELAEWPQSNGEWPDADGVKWATIDLDRLYFVAFTGVPFRSPAINEEQWLQRRIELINEPSDADAPEWANWKAQDSNGWWCWYQEAPQLSGNGVWSGQEVEWTGRKLGKIPAGHDWRKTLKQVVRSEMEQPTCAPLFQSQLIQGTVCDLGASKVDDAIGHTIARLDIIQNKESQQMLLEHLECLLELQLQELSHGVSSVP